jgi:hypothetical protein
MHTFTAGDKVRVDNKVSGGILSNREYVITRVYDADTYRKFVNDLYKGNNPVYELENFYTVQSDYVMGPFNLESETRSVVSEWMAANKSFTAYDVTTELRKRNSGQNIPHDGVKTIVHNMYDNGTLHGYMRKLVDVGRPDVLQPWLYFRAYTQSRPIKKSFSIVLS